MELQALRLLRALIQPTTSGQTSGSVRPLALARAARESKYVIVAHDCRRGEPVIRYCDI